MSENLKRLLDTTIERFDNDKKRRELGVPVTGQPVGDDQLALFTQSEDGATWVAHDGQTL